MRSRRRRRARVADDHRDDRGHDDDDHDRQPAHGSLSHPTSSDSSPRRSSRRRGCATTAPRRAIHSSSSTTTNRRRGPPANDRSTLPRLRDVEAVRPAERVAARRARRRRRVACQPELADFGPEQGARTGRIRSGLRALDGLCGGQRGALRGRERIRAVDRHVGARGTIGATRQPGLVLVHDRAGLDARHREVELRGERFGERRDRDDRARRSRVRRG